MATTGGYTGRTRRRSTSRGVVVADRAARGLVTVGGVATIVLVLTVMIFLFWVALPLFRGADLGRAHALPAAADVRRVALAPDQRSAWALLGDGRLAGFSLPAGAPLPAREALPGRVVVAAAFAPQGGGAALAFDDGSVRLADFAVDEAAGVVPTLREPLAPAGAPVARRLGYAQTQGGPVVAVLGADGRLTRHLLRERRNLLTDAVSYQEAVEPVPYAPPAAGDPDWLLVTGDGRGVLLAWRDGTLRRYAAGPGGTPACLETRRLAPDGAGLTALGLLGDGLTLVAGDARGRLSVWFLARGETATASDGAQMVMAREFAGPPAAVTALGFSARGGLFAAGFADGSVRVCHATSGRQIAAVTAAPGTSVAPVTAVALAPKDDGLLALTAGGARLWRFDARHPEASLAALFRPVWYQGYPRPEYVWQSSAATDEAELKFSLVPLVFGTLKATLYSLLFGVPLALLAAIFTSEFLSAGAKAAVKPAIELMASLPSVVLGFLAALVIAPFAERFVPATLAALLTVPAALLGGALLWQLLPHRAAIRLGRWRALPLAAAVPVGVGLAAWLGPVAERLLFAGDLKRWLDGQVGGPVGGWIPLLLPAAGVAAALAAPRLAAPLRRRYAGWSRPRAGLAEIAVTAGGAGAALAVAVGAAALLGGLGLDPRGHLVGTYLQRNALVVGFVMGFAIIPIVYTIAEDALSSVPEHLRAASLGAGATPWQTAVRIIVPTAMSGLFSAVMIGLGRAVGETMIVLMAAGNTPILDWNVFNGFRTLSANIAVEMPEAVRNSTHYRILFLSALLLFAITFIINTAAEFVRQHFRRRAYEL